MTINLDLADGPAVVVADTGPGFSDDPEHLTRPFFSRRPEGMGWDSTTQVLSWISAMGASFSPSASEADVPKEFSGAVLAMVFPSERKA